MENNIFQITEVERDRFVTHLVNELPVLRTKLGISQEELGSAVGITRQTYSSIETKKRKMSWGLFLSLLLIFDNDDRTHDFLHKQGIFPQKLNNRRDTDIDFFKTVSSVTGITDQNIVDSLDESAIHAIETVIMVEYARCNNMTGEAVIKAFDGKRLILNSEKDVKTRKSLANIKAASTE